jgi:chromosome segregation ATPase
MSAELSEHLAGWDGVRSALTEVRATHGEFQQFFSDVFDQLGRMLAELAGRRGQWEAERKQIENELARKTAQLQEDRAALSAQRENLGQDAQAAAQSTEQLRRLLEDVQRERSEIRETQQQLQAQVARLADAAGDGQLRQVLEEIRQQRAELRDAQEKAQAHVEQLAAAATKLANARGDLTQGITAAGNDQLGQALEEIREQRAELRGAQEAAQNQAEQLAAVAAELTEARSGLAQKITSVGDDQLGPMLEEIRRQRAELRGAQEAAQNQAEQLAAVATELAGARSALTQKTTAPGDGPIREMLEEIRRQRAELRDAQDAAQAQVEQLATVAAQLADARGELVEARNENAQRWEQLEARQAAAAPCQHDEELQERFRRLEREQALLEQERTVLESELEAVRTRAAEMAESLADQKRQAAAQRAEWAAELKRMRRLLEGISGRLAEGAFTAGVLPSDSHVPAIVGAGIGSAVSNGDPVLDSVAAQFEMLQRDLARRRAARAEHQGVT